MSETPAPRLRVVFFGSPAFAVPSLQALAERHDVTLVVTQPDRPAGRGMKLSPPPVKELAETRGIPVVQPARIKGDEDFLERLRGERADVFIVVAYGRILPQALLDVPRLGPFNVHASLLPKYRGAAPIQWAVINDEPETGVCIMRMEAGLDTGPVVACRRVPITDRDTAGTMFESLAQVGAALLTDTLPAIAAGIAAFEAQDHALATLAPMLSKEDGKLDFTRPSRAVSARARGVDPWPGAFALLDGEPVKLFGPRIVIGRTGAPGEVLGLSPLGLLVACGDGAVAFTDVQLPGRKRLPAAAVLAGRPIAPGTRLG